MRREAIEEASLKLDSLELVLKGWSMPGLSTERMYFYLARYWGEAHANVRGGVAAEDEDTVPVAMNLSELAKRADRGQFLDVKTMLLVQTLRLRKPELFLE